MKCICSNCGRSEIVISDSATVGLVCKATLLKATMEYTDLLMSPNFVIRRFRSVVGKHGWAEAMKGRLKQEREACISAIWAYGIQSITGVEEYWIEVETKERTPDCKVVFFDQSAGYNHRKVMNVEIVEWDLHRGNMLELIGEKCAKAYPSYFFLVVFVRNDKETLVEDILQKIKRLTVPFAEIWIVGRLPFSIGSYRIFMAHPEPAKVIDFGVFENYIKNLTQISFFKAFGQRKS